jgi:hypothetical protein
VASLMRAQEIRSVSRMPHSESLANAVIRPDVTSFSILDSAAYEPVIEIGFQAAREQLTPWRGAP